MDPMDLFERYLQAVRKYLPWRRQDDIVAELRTNLEAQREEREAELGRPLTEGEMVDWLKELGPPVEMAGRYQPPRYLIGPTIFPVYWWILRLVLLWASVGYAISIVVRVFAESHGPEWVAGQVLQYPMVLMMAAGWVTAAFVALQFIAERYPEKCPDLVSRAPHWSPTTLPPVEKAPPAGSKPRSFAGAVAEAVLQLAVIVWILLIPRYPVLLMGPGAAILDHSPVRLAPISITWFWALIALNVLQLAWQGVNFLTGNWRFRSQGQQIAIKALGLVPLFILLGAPGHIYLEANPAEAARMPANLDLPTVNHWLFFAVIALICLVLSQLVMEIRKFNDASARSRVRANGSPLRMI